jgi:multiple sugar transport system substrate-binding protein
MKKLASCLSVMGLACGLVFANGTADSQTASKPVTLTFWYENAGPARTPYIQELISRFEKENPDIKIEYSGFSNSDAKSKLDVAVASLQTPDVSGIQLDWVASGIANGALEPLDKYFNAWPEHGDQNNKIISLLRSYDVHNGLYMLPNTTNFTPTYWIRSDWMKQKGLAVPQTWNDFFTVIKKLTDTKAGVYGYSIRGGAGAAEQLYDYLYGYSGISRAFTEDGKSTINDPKHVEALERLAAIYNVYTPQSDITNSYKEMVAAFDSGTAAMIQHNLGSYSEHSKALADTQFEAFVPPVGSSGKRIISSMPTGFCIYKTSKHKIEAFKFIAFLCSKTSQSYFNQNIGQLPVNTTIINEPWLAKAQRIQVALKAMNDSASVLIVKPQYLPDYSTITNQLVVPDFQAVLSGKMTAKVMLDRWADAMTAARKEYNTYMKK